MDTPDFRSKNQPSLDQNFTKSRFQGKVCVVTGGASGIGFATAERFLNDGAAVAIVDINKENGENAKKYLMSEGFKNVEYYYADITNKNICDKVAQKVAENNGGVIHALVNSAVHFGSRALDSDASHWRETFDVNIYGNVAMLQACHPFMAKAKSSAVVNLTSISAQRAQPNRWTYSASKGAIKTMTKNMALDLAKDGIRVNSISPGWIWTPEMKKASKDGTLESMLPTVENFSILKRVGHTSETASVVAFLCSRDASYITGANIDVSGGYLAIGPERHGDSALFAATKQNCNVKLN